MDGADIMLAADNPEGVKQKWVLFGAKATYNF